MGIVVNQYWLDHLWDPISSATAEAGQPLDEVDVADESAVRRLARQYLAPGFAQMTPTQQQALKESFRYGLNALTDRQLERTLARCLPPFRQPQHVRLQVPPNIHWFYEVIWQELFRPEDWHIQDVHAYTVDRRFSTPFPAAGIVVNQYWLDHLWPPPIGGGADIDDNPLDDLNAEDEREVRRLVREYLAPVFALFPPTQQFRLKETFRYGLNAFSDSSLEHAFERCLPPFSAPHNIRWFYEVIWQEMFGSEDWHIQDLGQYVVDNTFVNAHRTFSYE